MDIGNIDNAWLACDEKSQKGLSIKWTLTDKTGGWNYTKLAHYRNDRNISTKVTEWDEIC